MKHCLLLSACLLSLGADWPMYKGNPTRSAFTNETLPEKLDLRWTVVDHPSSPAWPISNRLGFDRAAQPIVAQGMVFVGSSADHRVRAFDATTGVERWHFFTSGPVRFAPAFWKDRLFVVSDDGWLYCLNATDGKLHWKKQGGPDDRRVLGNERMIARQPARGGPVVADDIVYYGAGIWPSEGIFLYALDAATGKQLWCNDSSGSIYMGQPHGGAYAASGAAAQGYLVVNDDQLLVPTGRAVPAIYDRETGKFKYFHLQANTRAGGAATTAIGALFFNAGFTYDAITGKVLDPVGAGEVAALPDGLVVSNTKDLLGYEWVQKSKTDKKSLELLRYKGLQRSWSIPDVPGGTALVVAGDHAIAGGPGKVTVANRKTKKAVFSAPIDGAAHGLAVADGKLFVSTDTGKLYCFDASGEKAVVHQRTGPAVAEDKIYTDAAAEIVNSSGVKLGYCADLGCGDGSLALALAKQTELQIIAVDADIANVEKARAMLSRAGVYGTRVTVLHADPAHSNLPKYFADLIVSGRSVKDGTPQGIDREVNRIQRPFGGIAMLGRLGEIKKSVRGPLEGAGNWTHQYADPGNSSNSADVLVQGQLGILWFRDSDLDSPSRHGRAPAPLFFEGRLIVEGTNELRAVDAYNGRLLWRYDLPGILKPYAGEHLNGTAITQSNYCVSAEGIFVRQNAICLRIDPATGKKLGQLTAPRDGQGKVQPWGYLAVQNGIVFGSLSDTAHVVKNAYSTGDMRQQFSESKSLFAMDPITGKTKWVYHAKDSLRHNALAIGADKVYLIDRPVAVGDLLKGANKDKEHPPGQLVTLDAQSGKELWRSDKNVYGTMLAVSPKHDVLLMSYQPTRFKLPSEVGGRMAAFKASTGKPLWDQEAKYGVRPMINDRTILTDGGSWDLVSGAAKPFAFKRSYGCGQITGGAHMMVFRSATLGYYDLLSPKGVIDYGGIRPGCWINAIPAGGLVLVPDATSGCSCSYLNQAWMALQPLE